jgi:hypothetical protein
VIDAIAAQQTIYVCEGEKDCDNLHSRGFAATTNPGGANKWRDALTPHFRGADVVIIADNDEPGRKHVADVAAKLSGTAKRIRLLDLALVWSECPIKGDISHWLDAGHKVEELGAIITQLPDWKPAEKKLIRATPYIHVDPKKLKPRGCIYEPGYIRKFISMTIATSKVGKSSKAIVEALAMVTGLPLLGIRPHS